MAEAQNTEGEEEVHAMREDVERSPVMPHRVHTEAQLREQSPSVKVPPAADEGDPLADVTESLLDHGLRIAERITKDAEERGRRRKGCDI